MGAAIKIEDDVAIIIPKTMGNAKLWTALPPHIAIGNIARTVVVDVKRQRIRT